MNDINEVELTTALSSFNSSRCQSKYSFDELKKLAINVLKNYNKKLIKKYGEDAVINIQTGEIKKENG